VHPSGALLLETFEGADVERMLSAEAQGMDAVPPSSAPPNGFNAFDADAGANI
jgi:hypothetical protein